MVDQEETKQENIIEIIKLLKEFYDNGLLNIKWGLKGYAWTTRKSADDKIKELNIDRKYFNKQIARILIAAKKIVNRDNLNNDDNEFYSNVQKYFLDTDLFDQINLRTNSRHNVFSEVSSELITRREKTNLKNVLSYSSLISITFYDNTLENLSDRDKTISIEFTKSELVAVIEKLKSVVDEFDIVNE